MAGFPSLWNKAFDCGGQPGIRMKEILLLLLPRFVKRVMDFMIIIIGGICLSPLIALIALLVKISSPGPIFYKQERFGFRGQPFQVWKFRTMTANADNILESYLFAHPELKQEWEKNHKLKNDSRITRISHWLRKTSLDELPQLWNVVLVEMSLVGPRPIVKSEIPKYSDSYDLYTKVLPGISGLWQISGRNNTTYAKRVSLAKYTNATNSLDFASREENNTEERPKPIVTYSPPSGLAKSNALTSTDNTNKKESIAAIVLDGFALNKNYPNPFNLTTAISYLVPQAARVQMTVYNAIGQQIAILFDGLQSVGNHTIHFYSKDLLSGTYFIRMQAVGFQRTEKMIVVK